VETVEALSQRLRIGDIVGALTLVAGALSAASYAFALGYIFAIEPRFLPAFTVGDLLMLFVSSTSTAIFLALVLVPTLGMVFSSLMARRVMGKEWIEREFTEAEAEDPANYEIATEARFIKRASSQLYLGSLVATTCVTFLLMAAVIGDYAGGEGYTLSPLPNFVPVFGFVITFLAFIAGDRFASVAPVLLGIYILAALYVVGDMAGRRDMFGSAKSRLLPCGYIDKRADCVDIIYLGSQAAILRRGGHAILVKRDRLRSIQTRG